MAVTDVLSLRIAHSEKQALAAAAERTGTTLTGYALAAITERTRAETIADRLLVAILAALDDHTKQITGQVNALHARVDATASKDDLRRLAEWIASRTTNGRTS